MQLTFFRRFAVLIPIISIPGMLAGESYVYFGVPGSNETSPTSINSPGDVTGVYYNSSGTHGFVRASDGAITTFDVPGSLYTQPTSINTRGDIAGNCTFGGFVRTSDGTITTFNAPGADPFNATHALSINSFGDVTGYYSVNGVYQHGYLRTSDGIITEFELGNATSPASINDSGMIAGTFADTDVDGFQGFVRAADGSVTKFQAPLPNLFRSINVTAMNGSGLVIGQLTTSIRIGAEPFFQGFLWDAQGGFRTFVAGSHTLPLSINNRGEIVGGISNTSSGVGAFIRGPGGLTTYFPPFSGGSSVNDSGVIAGGSLNGAFVRFP